MEKKKKKDQQLAPFCSATDPDINGVSLNPNVDEDHDKQDDNSQNQDGVELSGKKPRISSPSNENASYQNPQNPPNFQWSNPLQPANENQVAAATSSQWQPQIQLNAGSHQTQQFQLPPHLVASIPPAFWLPHRPGYQPQGAHNINSCHPFPQMDSFDSRWQVPAGNGMVTTSSRPGQSPSVFYPFGYPHPTFSGGPWDPSSWWGQARQCPPFCIYPFPGAFNYFPSPAPRPTTNCSAPSGQSSQKGVIQPSMKISQKHQLLWDAQSAENVQLWAAITGLQTDLADVKSRLLKFETEAKSLKSLGEQMAAHGTCTGNTSTGQATKRGRTRKVVASVDALPSPHEPHPRPRARRPAFNTSKGPLEIREINFQKDDKKKVEFMDTVSTLIPTYQHANGKKFTTMFRTGGNPSGIYQSQRNTIVSNSSEAKAAEQVKIFTGDVFDQGNGKVVPWSMVNESNNTSEDLDEATAESDKEEDEEMYNVASTCTEGIPTVKNEVPYGANDLEDGNPQGFLCW